MDYRWNSAWLGDMFAIPAAVADQFLKLSNGQQIKVLLWLCRVGKGHFDAEACAAATGISAAACEEALDYWVGTGLLSTDEAAQAVALPPPPVAEKAKTPRPPAVKPQMPEVIARQRACPEIAYLLESVGAKLGKTLSPGDMETLVYLHDTAGLPAEVILLVVAHACEEGHPSMRWIEKAALGWADQGLYTIDAAEQHLCQKERRRNAWAELCRILALTEDKPTTAQLDFAEKWLCTFPTDEALLRLAYAQCVESTGKFVVNYMNKVLDGWRAEGIDSPEKLNERKRPPSKTAAESSLDLDGYESSLLKAPVYKRKKS